MIIKRILKIISLVVLSIIAFALLFVLTLQVFEYQPDDLTTIPIDYEGDESFPSVELDQVIRIMSFNIGYASLSETEDFAMDGGTKGRMDSKQGVLDNMNGILNLMEQASADIYLLQEVDVDSARSYHVPQYTMIQNQFSIPSTLGYNYRVLFVPFPLNPRQMMGQVNSGVVSLFQFPIQKATRVQLPGAFDWPLRLANLKRCIVVHRLNISGSDKQLIVINVHLSAYDDGTMRLQEMAKLQEIMLAEYQAGHYVVVGGDFNQSFPGTYSITGQDELGKPIYEFDAFPLRNPAFWQAYGMDESWFTDHGFSFGFENGFPTPTCRLLHQPYDTENPENNQYYYIDGFIVSNNVKIESVQVINQQFKYSDHNPVVMEVKLLP